MVVNYIMTSVAFCIRYGLGKYLKNYIKIACVIFGGKRFEPQIMIIRKQRVYLVFIVSGTLDKEMCQDQDCDRFQDSFLDRFGFWWLVFWDKLYDRMPNLDVLVMLVKADMSSFIGNRKENLIISDLVCLYTRHLENMV